MQHNQIPPKLQCIWRGKLTQPVSPRLSLVNEFSLLVQVFSDRAVVGRSGWARASCARPHDFCCYLHRLRQCYITLGLYWTAPRGLLSHEGDKIPSRRKELKENWKWLAVLFCIWEVLVSNLGREAGLPVLGSSRFSSFPQVNAGILKQTTTASFPLFRPIYPSILRCSSKSVIKWHNQIGMRILTNSTSNFSSKHDVDLYSGGSRFECRASWLRGFTVFFSLCK
jgi:hypothetical protein